MATEARTTQIKRIAESMSTLASELQEIYDEMEGEDQEDNPLFGAVDETIGALNTNKDALIEAVTNNGTEGGGSSPPPSP